MAAGGSFIDSTLRVSGPSSIHHNPIHTHKGRKTSIYIVLLIYLSLGKLLINERRFSAACERISQTVLAITMSLIKPHTPLEFRILLFTPVYYFILLKFEYNTLELFPAKYVNEWGRCNDGRKRSPLNILHLSPILIVDCIHYRYRIIRNLYMGNENTKNYYFLRYSFHFTLIWNSYIRVELC